MTAVLAPSSSAATSAARSSGRNTAPQLRVIEGGRSERALARRKVFLRRRVAVALCATVLVAVGGWALVSAVAPAFGASAGSAVGSPAAELPAEVVVAEGDTLWGISAALGVDADIRVVVDELASANGGTDVRPGQRLVVPASLRR